MDDLDKFKKLKIMQELNTTHKKLSHTTITESRRRSVMRNSRDTLSFALAEPLLQIERQTRSLLRFTLQVSVRARVCILQLNFAIFLRVLLISD